MFSTYIDRRWMIRTCEIEANFAAKKVILLRKLFKKLLL